MADDKKKTTAAKLRSNIDRIAENDAAEQGNAPPAEAPPAEPAAEKPKKKPAESVGTGRPTFDMEAFRAKIDAQIAATTNPELKAKLEARKKEVEANQ